MDENDKRDRDGDTGFTAEFRQRRDSENRETRGDSEVREKGGKATSKTSSETGSDVGQTGSDRPAPSKKSSQRTKRVSDVPAGPPKTAGLEDVDPPSKKTPKTAFIYRGLSTILTSSLGPRWELQDFELDALDQATQDWLASLPAKTKSKLVMQLAKIGPSIALILTILTVFGPRVRDHLAEAKQREEQAKQEPATETEVSTASRSKVYDLYKREQQESN